MRILERSVTKHYWMKMYRYLFRKIQREHFEDLGKKRGYRTLKFVCGKSCLAYAVCVQHQNDWRPIAWLYLWQKPGWQAWEVMQVFVFEKVRGLGLAKHLYQMAIDHDLLIMASGKTQSASSRALWKSFIQKNTFDIFAIDYKKMSERSDVFWDADAEELWCQMPIYLKQNEYVDRDVRLIATRRQR